MLVSRHRIGKYLPEVVHQGPDPAAVAVCREVLAESGAECVILHGSRGWGGLGRAVRPQRDCDSPCRRRRS